MVEHTKLFEELLGDIKSFAIMKKHYKAYCTGFAGAKELRLQLMEEAKNAADVERLVKSFLQKISDTIE
jgi:tRNA-dihydrouridine synthase